MTVIQPFSPEQERALINLRQRYYAWMDAERELRALPYDLRRKKVGGYEYLYEIFDRSGNGTSLGAWDEENQRRFENYREQKRSTKQRREGANEALAESSRIARALRLPLLSADAGPILRERVGWFGWAATAAGFAGVMLIVRPGSGLMSIGVLFVLGAVVANLGYQLLSRVLSASETTFALLFYTALTGSILYGLAVPWFIEGRALTWLEIVLFASLGVYGGVGHYLYTAAFRFAPASLLAPLNYAQLIWAGLLGWLVFGHMPDAVSLLGMAIVAGSGVAVALKTRRPPPKRMA